MINTVAKYNPINQTFFIMPVDGGGTGDGWLDQAPTNRQNFTGMCKQKSCMPGHTCKL